MDYLNLKFDPTSDRNKVCKYCGKPFIAHHRGMLFCEPKCADEFHNRKKRMMKAHSLEKNKMDLPQQTESAKITPPPETPVDAVNNLMNNIQIIDRIDPDSIKGTLVAMEYLATLGYDHNCFSGQGILYNIDPSLNCHFIQVGVYRLFRKKFSHLLIVKIQ